MNREEQIDSFYKLLDKLIEKYPLRYLNGIRNGDLPEKGVYFFFEEGEYRATSDQKRVVRIGTHAAQAKSKATLYKRLKQHSGPNHGYGRNRNSVQRELIGYSIRNKYHPEDYPEWGIRSYKNDPKTHEKEKSLEKLVTDYILKMPFIILEVPGDSAKDNWRAYIESNSIILLSNYCKTTIDPPSENWLGLSSCNDKVKESGLWNRKEIDVKKIDIHKDFFRNFERFINEMGNFPIQ
jgi:hypothetical protein